MRSPRQCGPRRDRARHPVAATRGEQAPQATRQGGRQSGEGATDVAADDVAASSFSCLHVRMTTASSGPRIWRIGGARRRAGRDSFSARVSRAGCRGWLFRNPQRDRRRRGCCSGACYLRARCSQRTHRDRQRSCRGRLARYRARQRQVELGRRGIGDRNQARRTRECRWARATFAAAVVSTA